MKIAVIGSGYVGLVSGACLSEFGHQVVCIDMDAGKIQRLRAGEIPIYEPGLEDLVERNAGAKRLSFSTDIADIDGAQAIFIAVGTPSRRGDGHADMTYVHSAAKQIAAQLKDYAVIVTKSTVPVGTGREVEKIVRETNPKAQFDVASNPEFLREGAAITDFMKPDRVVIGTDGERAKEIMRQIYRPLFLIDTPIVFTKLETAELIKYSANAFLAMKITFINQIADLCEKVGADVHDVARGIGLDGRIGGKFLHPSPGFGGSCFPKDTRALIQTARDAGSPLSLIEATLDFNEARKTQMADRIVAALGGNAEGKTVAVLGLTFKPNTDDMREAASVTIVPALQKHGIKIRAHDPEGMDEAKKQMPDLDYRNDPYEAIEGADALVILTEWNSYRSLDLDRVKALLKSPVFVDLRNIYRPAEMQAAGFRYSSLGRTA
jgi:UDPglucose 6-dehydrogenase